MESYVVVDIETTGTHPINSDIIEIGAVYIENGIVKGRFNELICPNQEISPYITSITGITDEMVVDKPTIEEIMPRFLEFCKDVPLVGHNIILFDYRMLKAKATGLGYKFDKLGVDTLVIARKMLPELPSRKLGDLCTHYNICLKNAHRAYDDAYATYELFVHLQNEFKSKEPKVFEVLPMVWEVPKYVPITEKQKVYLKSLCERYHIVLDQNIDKLSKSEGSRLIDRIIATHGKVIKN